MIKQLHFRVREKGTEKLCISNYDTYSRGIVFCELRVVRFEFVFSHILRVVSCELRVASWLSIISVHSILSFLCSVASW